MALVLFALVLSSNVWGYTGTFSDYMSSTLIDGIYVVASSSTASSAKAMGTTISSGRLTGQTVSTSNPGDALVWYIEYTADGWTFKNYSNSKYLKQNTTTSGKGMSLEDTPGYFNLDGYNSTSPVGYKFSSKDQTSNQYFKYNNGSSWFSNYTSGYSTSMTPIRLYRLPKYRAKTTQPGTGSFMASASDATWDATNNHLSWLSSGTTVTLTATPPSGKEVDSWTVTKASGGTVTVSNNTFSMPADQVTISVTWKTAAPSCTTKPTVSSSLSGTSSTTSSITATVGITNIGGCNITENGLVYSTTNSTPTVGGSGCSKETVTACGSTAANKTVTISGLECGQSYYVCGYATNDAGTQYSNVSQISTSACPVDHFIDNIQETTGYTGDGKAVSTSFTKASITLSDKAAATSGSCEEVHYHFVGWVTEADRSAGNVDAEHIVNFQDSGNTPDGTTYYAVWAAEQQ